MMNQRKRSGFSLTVVVVVLLLTMMAVVVGAYRCQQMRGDCRLVVQEDGDDMLTRNISCYCKHGEEVSRALDQLSGVTCMEAAGRHVNTSIVHIVGCTVDSQLFPRSLLSTCRQSTHLSLYLGACPWVSLTTPTPRTDHAAPATITATFLNSNVSGIPAGVVSGAGVQAVIRVEGGQVGVVESRAFSGYPRDAHVSVTFTNTEILTVKQGAFDLPPSSLLSIVGGKVLKLERHSYSGGAELTLSGVRVANLLPYAVNIFGLKKLHMTNCIVAAVYADALEHRVPTYVRVVTGGQRVLEGSEAVFSGNTFMGGNGQAFAQLCTVDRLTWRNNTMLTSSDMPPRLQGPDCPTHRDWPQVFGLNALSCQDCTHFTNPDHQTCALYQTSYCISCDAPMDQCNKPILPYITNKCLASHPHIARHLNNTCGVPTSAANARIRTSKALEDKGSAASASLAPLLFVVTLGVILGVLE